jgi:hypothetical protein
MKPVRRARLHLENLEDRTCPSFTIRAIAGSLYINGTPQLAGPTAVGDQFLVQETSANHLTVQENYGGNTKTYGTFPAGKNIFVTLAHYNTNINVDFNGFTWGGSLLMNLGLGDTDLSTTNPVSIYSGVMGGSIRGNVTVLNGSGGEQIAIGQVGSSPGTPAALNVGGNVTVAARKAGSNPFALNAGDSLFIGPGSIIGGNLTTAFVDGVNIGEGSVSGVTPTPLSTVMGNVTISDAGSSHFIDVEDFGVVGGNVSVTGTTFGDTFTLEQTVDALGGTIAGNLTLNLGAGNGAFGDLVDLAAGTSVGGTASITSLGGPNVGIAGGLYELGSAVSGDLTLNMGVGDNTVIFTGSVSGNMRVTAANGTNDLGGGALGGSFTGTVDGNLTLHFGNGTNTADIVNSPGGTLFWTSGNGSDTLSLEAAFFDAFINLGTGTNNLTLNAGTTLIGTVRGSGGSNTFTQNGGTVNNVTFIDFP